MKTSVKSIMMGMALTGCLIFSASDALAQGRGRSQAGGNSNRNLSATVSSSNNPTSTTVSNSPSSQVNRNTITPQVNRNDNNSVSSSTSAQRANRNDATPQVNRNDNIRVSQRDDSQSTGSSGSSIRKGDATTRTVTSTQDGSGNNGGNNDKPGNGGKPGNSSNPSTPPRPDGSGPGISPRPDGGGPSMPPPRPDGGGPGTPPRPDGGGPSMPPPRPDGGGPGMPPPPDGGGPVRPTPIPDEICPCLSLPPHHVGSKGYGPENPYDYSYDRHYSEFSWNYEHHNWSRPLPPPARSDRPSFRGWFRPVIPAGWHSNIGAPFIDGILGIPFGTLADDALDYLYSNGYFIDGYANSIIYLRSVPLLKMTWDDVMLAFNTQGRLVNAEYIIRTTYCIGHCHSTSCRCSSIHNRINKYFYNRVYGRLSEIFGTPIKNGSGSFSWYGGDGTGWITLLTFTNSGNYYIMLSIGN